MSAQSFTAVIQIRGINPYVLVSAARAQALKPNWRRPIPVLVRINGKPAKAWQINMMPTGRGSFYLYLHAQVRKASATKVGDCVRVQIEFNAEYKNGPQHPMPRWFRLALTAQAEAMKNWIALTPSRQKEILRYFSALKSPKARVRNLAKVIHVLSGHPARFMARTWENGV